MSPARVPVTVLSGFLGSGKTTRLNELLRDPRGRRIGVVMNELGEVGVESGDRGHAAEFVELDGGCVCCTLNDDLGATLDRLAARGGIDHLVIETTGVGDPLAVTWLVERGELARRWRVDAVVTVVDAESVVRLRAAAEEVDLQIARADVVLLSKLDRTPEREAEIRSLVHELNPRARILPSPRGATPWDVLLDVGAEPHDDASPAHPHLAPWETWTFRSETTVDEARLESFLYGLPPAVVRVKGIVRTEAGWCTVHAVGGRYDLVPGATAPPDGRSVLVAIGRDLDRPALAAALAPS